MNKILESLSTTLGELINRSFVTAGILPGMLLLVGMSWYRNGLSGTRTAVEQAFASGETFLQAFGWWVVILLLLAWMLVAVRPLIQRFLADPPLPWVRDKMRDRHLSRWTKLRNDIAAWLERHGAIKWQDPGDRFQVLRGDNTLPQPTYDIVALESSTRTAQSLLAQDKAWTHQDLYKLGDALRPIWLASRWPKDAVVPMVIEQLLQKWTKWLAGNEARIRRLNDAVEQSEREVHRAYLRMRDFYPDDPTWVQPTRFGNRFAALDDYAQQRYGIGTTTLWSRLWGVLTTEEQDEFRGAEQAVTALANLWLVFVMLAVLVLIAEAVEGVRLFAADTGMQPDGRAMAFILGAGALAILAYRAAVTSVGGLMEVMYRWIDLKRLALLTALGHEAPRTVAEEMMLYKELDTFFGQATPRAGWRKLSLKVEDSA